MSEEIEPSFCEQITQKYDRKELQRPVYVIQEHHASRLHWDLRFEFDEVLRSWALPKPPPTREGEKRLAVSVPDHPLEYALFEGQIPEGVYGAGTVKIWDHGTFKVIENKPRKIIIDITGEKLQGKYCLLHFKPQEKNWLFFKIK